MPNSIKVSQLSKSFSTQQVIKDISFSINEGEVFVILGKNGAGKTTLIKMLLNILLPDSGEIYYKDKKIQEYGQKLYSFTSAVLENSENTYGYLSAYGNIEYFAALHKKKLKKADMDKLLAQFGLAGEGQKRVSKFSRGMKQKLSIICGLLSDAQIIFLDEPTLGLDFKSNKELLKTVKVMAKQEGKTIILTSHQADVIEALADSVMLLDGGQISYLGKYSDFISRNNLSSYEITSADSKYSFDSKPQADEKLASLIENGIEILSYQERKRTIDEILIDFYEGEKSV